MAVNINFAIFVALLNHSIDSFRRVMLSYLPSCNL